MSSSVTVRSGDTVTFGCWSCANNGSVAVRALRSASAFCTTGCIFGAALTTTTCSVPVLGNAFVIRSYPCITAVLRGTSWMPVSFSVMPARMHHFAWVKEETTIQLHGIGPWDIVYVNSADDPRGKSNQQAQK